MTPTERAKLETLSKEELIEWIQVLLDELKKKFKQLKAEKP